MKLDQLLFVALLVIVAAGCSGAAETQTAAVEGAPATAAPKATVDPQNVRRPPDPEAMRKKFMDNAAKGGPPPAPGGM